MVAREEIGADEQENEMGFVEVLVDDNPPFLTSADLVRGPGADEATALEGRQMGLQGSARRLVGGGVRDEYVDGHAPPGNTMLRTSERVESD